MAISMSMSFCAFKALSGFGFYSCRQVYEDIKPKKRMAARCAPILVTADLSIGMLRVSLRFCFVVIGFNVIVAAVVCASYFIRKQFLDFYF
ncbi:MAG: hypothetical protein ACK400_06375, partial [Pseudanabaena sp.]